MTTPRTGTVFIDLFIKYKLLSHVLLEKIIHPLKTIKAGYKRHATHAMSNNVCAMLEIAKETNGCIRYIKLKWEQNA